MFAVPFVLGSLKRGKCFTLFLFFSFFPGPDIFPLLSPTSPALFSVFLSHSLDAHFTLQPPLSLPFYLGGLIRDAVSKVRRVLPGSRDDECDPPLCIDPNDSEAMAAAAAAAADAAGQGQDTPSFGGLASEQGSSFVEAVREAAAALDVAGAKEVGSRLAEKVCLVVLFSIGLIFLIFAVSAWVFYVPVWVMVPSCVSRGD